MKYNISEDFKFLRNFKSSLNPIFLRVANIILSLLPKGMNSSEEFNIKKIKIKARDNKNITTFIIKPQLAPKDNLPVIFYLHGGAFVFKGAPSHYEFAKNYAINTNAMVVYIDYRVAYNTPFETSLNDCIDVYKYIINNAHKYGINKNKIIIAGDSAGGYLSVVTTIRLKNENFILPRSQMLIYPALDCRCQTNSMQVFFDTPMWNSRLNKEMWKLYSNGNVVENPLLNKDLSFMPRTYIEVAEYDCLRDEAILFYKRLNKVREGDVLHNTSKTIHGYDVFTDSPITKDSFKRRYKFLKSNLD